MLIENIILLEQNPELRDRLFQSLSARGCAVRTVPALEAAQDAAGTGDADLLILYLACFAESGRGFFEGFRPGAFKPLVLLVAAPDFRPAGLELALAEAFDLLVEPFSEAQFELAVSRAESHARVLAANRLLSQDQGPGLKADLIGISPAMDLLRKSIRQVALTQAAVLVQGECGTGQEVVAKALLGAVAFSGNHRTYSIATDAPSPRASARRRTGRGEGQFSMGSLAPTLPNANSPTFPLRQIGRERWIQPIARVRPPTS